MPAKEHISESRVGQPWDTTLLAKVKRDIAHVRLDMPERER